MEKEMESAIMALGALGMERKMETTIMGFIGTMTTMRIHSFIPSQPKARTCLEQEFS